MAAVPAEQLATVDLSQEEYDEEQVRLMEERCILVDEEDKVLGDVSKKDAHLMTNISRGLLHRAFSVFLFCPSDGRLLLQQRATEKITFPDLWTNTCCSHPLAIRAELEEDGSQIGVRRAAQRKLEHELGIKNEEVPLDKFVYLTKIHYLAPSDGMWGEHEVDYILFVTADVNLSVNRNEIRDERWVSKSELQALLADPAYAFTPWFRIIVESFLFPWWDALVARARPDGSVDAETVRELADGKLHKML